MLLNSDHIASDPDVIKVLKTLENQILSNKIVTAVNPSAARCQYDPYYVSAEYRQELMSRPGEPLDTNERSHLQYIATDIGPELFSALWKHFPDSCIKLSGHFLYSEQDFMGWHTNAGAPGTRIYSVYVPESDKSFFRYYDADTDTTITSWDKAGWNVRMFWVNPAKPFWHCVYSETKRYSFGVNIMDF